MNIYTRFLKLISPHSGIFGLGIICMIFASVFEASPLALIIPVVDKIVSGKNIILPEEVDAPVFVSNLVNKVNAMPSMDLLKVLILFLVVTFALKTLFDFLKTYFMCDLSQRVIRDVKNAIYEKLLGLSMDFYSHNPTGLLMARITHDAAVIRDAISTGIADSFLMPIKIVTYLVTLITIKIYFAIPWALILVAAVVFPLILFPVIKIGKRLRKISTQSQEKIADISNMLLETISGIKLVKSFNMENYEKKRFFSQNHIFYKLSMRTIKRMKIVSPLTEFFSIACISIILWMAGKSIVNGELSAGPFIAFIAAILSLMKPAKKLSNVYGINQQALAAAERIFAILDTPVTVKEKPDARDMKDFGGEITFENVSFGYDKEEVLKNVNLSVKKGEIVALVGPSGGGKTSLVNLIPRFYDPDSGSVKINGIDIREYTIRSLREKIGLVTQETILFNNTLKANLCYGHEDDIDEEKLIRSAEAANAHMFIKEFPEKYDTVIGERGIRLSGGQRQRLALARAVYKNPPILILDEATSQLDSESEKLVQDAINNLMEGRTVIAIAHRLSTVTHADKIVVVDNGSIVDIGKHEELLHRNPLYKRLYEIQFADKSSG